MSREQKRIKQYISKVTSWKFSFFLMFKLPLAYIARLRIKQISNKEATIGLLRIV